MDFEFDLSNDVDETSGVDALRLTPPRGGGCRRVRVPVLLRSGGSGESVVFGGDDDCGSHL